MKNYKGLSYLKSCFLISVLIVTLFNTNLLGANTNNWIDNSANYWKVRVAEQGIYKINYSDLQSVTDRDLATLNTSYFQLYRLGKQKPLFIHTGQNNSFDEGDFISFYGEKNDGTFDTGLYTKPGAAPNQTKSLYSDSATYFLTWNKGDPGKRYQVEKHTDFSSYQPKSCWMDTVTKVFEESYNSGDPLASNVQNLELSYYTNGEGWTSRNIVFWSDRNWKVPIPGHKPNGSCNPDPFVEIKLIGNSKADSAESFEPYYHHKTEINVDGQSIGSYLYKDYESKIVRANLSNFSGNEVNFNFFNKGYLDNGLSIDFSKIGYLKVAYPRGLEADKELAFSVRKSSDKTYLPFEQFDGEEGLVYAPKSQKILDVPVNNDKAPTLIPSESQGQQLYLTSKNAIETVQPTEAGFTDQNKIEANEPEFIIITNKKLKSSAKAYSDFRSKASGYRTEIVYIDNLFNTYAYGQHHSLGIRYFLESLVENNAEPDYLLLIGKGIETRKLRDGNLLRSDLVPTIGSPPTDNMFVSNLKEEGQPLTLAFPVGRIPASTNSGVLNYLNKVKAYNKALKSNDPEVNNGWFKQFLHISGGETRKESDRFKGYLERYESYANQSKLGPKIDLISKSTTVPVDKNQKDFVIDAVNEGRGLITYFGHGAAQILEVDIGDPVDYTQNKGNYPIFLFSGCIIGNSYTENTSMPEQFLVNQPNQGGVAWMAESAFSFETYLDRYTMNFYQTLLDSKYGEPLGKVFTATADKFSRDPGSRDYINEMQILQKTFHGDPALKVYSPKNPDYTTSSENLSFNPSQPNTSLDSFNLRIGVKNIGKVEEADSLFLNVQHQLSDLTLKTYGPKKVKAPAFADTFNFSIAVNDQDFKGDNTFTVNIANRSGISEIDTSNNSASTNIFFPSSSLTALEPKKYAIVNQRKPALKVQSNNLFLNDAAYKFQIDTTPTFTSPVKKASPTIKSGTFGTWEPGILRKDSTVYYWRAKKVSPEESDWIQSSFMYINNSSSGWAQGHFPQFKRNKAKKMTFFDSPNRKLSFDRKALGRYNIQTTGAERGKNKPLEYFIRYEGPKLFFPGAKPGIYILAIDQDEPSRLNYNSPYNKFTNKAPGDGTPKDDTTSGVFHFNWVKSNSQIDTSIVEDFVRHVKDSIPKGYTVMAFTARKHLVHKMPSMFYKAMESIGGDLVKQLPAKWPYIIIGEKGYQPGEATEKTADTTIPLDPENQLLKATKTLFTLQKSGEVTSKLIGPSRNWQDVFLETTSLESNSADSLAYDIIGIDRQRNQKPLKSGLAEGAHNLSGINANQYPYLKIRAHLSDNITQTPPQLKTWLIHYDYLPEGALTPETAFNFHNDTLQQGEKLSFKVAYTNISNFPMDSLKVATSIIGPNNQPIRTDTQKYSDLKPSDVLTVADSFSSDQLKGQNRLKVTVNPAKSQPERFLFNNVFQRDFYVSTDLTEPLLDVKFNGRYIKDNAVLNPRPSIEIKAKDDNNFYLMADTSRINVSLKYPNGQKKRLNYKEHLAFTPAKNGNDNKAIVRYKPSNKLPAGQYQLKVEASDITGNASGTVSYMKRFRVVSESAVVNFRAAPNPFSARTRFLFTLEGEQVPDEMRIKIFSLRGELVREISHQELMPLNLGKNKTEFLWDGNSRSGKQVSSGIYFYRLEAYIDGKEVPYKVNDKGIEGNDQHGKLILTR